MSNLIPKLQNFFFQGLEIEIPFLSISFKKEIVKNILLKNKAELDSKEVIKICNRTDNLSELVSFTNELLFIQDSISNK